MAFNRYEDGFDKCRPPVCPEDIQIDISITCSESNDIYVLWEITDTALGRDLTSLISSNAVVWSCGNELFDNTANLIRDSQPYETLFNIGSCDDIIYLKVKVQIDLTFIESEINFFDIRTCGEDSLEFMVQAELCDCDIAQEPPGYDLYMDYDGLPISTKNGDVSHIFKYDNLCWSIIVNSEDDKLPYDENQGIILADKGGSLTYDDCSSCCDSDQS